MYLTPPSLLPKSDPPHLVHDALQLQRDEFWKMFQKTSAPMHKPQRSKVINTDTKKMKEFLNTMLVVLIFSSQMRDKVTNMLELKN